MVGKSFLGSPVSVKSKGKSHGKVVMQGCYATVPFECPGLGVIEHAASVKGAPGHLNNGVKTKGMFPAVGDVAFPSSFDSRPNRIPGKCAPVDVAESVTV